MEGLAGHHRNSRRMRIFYLWPIVKLRSGPKIQISTNIRRRIAKTSLICIKTEIGKNEALSQMSELTSRAFHTPG